MIDMVIDRTMADVVARNEKGTYNASDLNRVGMAANYIKDISILSGYPVVGVFRTDWQDGEIPFAEEMEDYLAQVRKCKSGFVDVGIRLPNTIDGIDYKVANNIEKLFVLIEENIDRMKEAYRYCGTFDCGGDVL